MFDGILNEASLFILVFGRVYAIMQVAPILSSGSLPRIVRVLLAFFTATLLLPQISAAGYAIPAQPMFFLALLAGEVLIGVAIGFIITLVMAVFQLAGQMFSIPVGFGAAQAFDPLAQIEVPLLGQFYNLIAVFLFLAIDGLQRIFLIGIQRSFVSLTAADILYLRDPLSEIILSRLSLLFAQALVISIPIIGLLILVYLVIGLVAKAAPQMNLLILGFPFSIGIAFLILFLSFPIVADTFRALLEEIFSIIERLYIGVVEERRAS